MELKESRFQNQKVLMSEFVDALLAALAPLGTVKEEGGMTWFSNVYEVFYNIKIKTGFRLTMRLTHLFGAPLIQIRGRYMTATRTCEYFTLQVFQSEKSWPLIKNVVAEWKDRIDSLFGCTLKAVKIKED